MGDALVLKLDVTDQGQIDAAIKAAEEKFGRIDVLVNNAGIGYFAAVEESEEDQVRRMFEINVFGLSRMIHAVLPGMRKRRKGFIVNFSSIGGLRSFPSIGYYNATKFAVEGLSEALWQEVEPLGIKVMLVEPSGFRTDWAGRSANESKRQIDDYAATAGAWRSQVRAISGKQPGDPVRARARNRQGDRVPESAAPSSSWQRCLRSRHGEARRTAQGVLRVGNGFSRGRFPEGNARTGGLSRCQARAPAKPGPIRAA